MDTTLTFYETEEDFQMLSPEQDIPYGATFSGMALRRRGQPWFKSCCQRLWTDVAVVYLWTGICGTVFCEPALLARNNDGEATGDLLPDEIKNLKSICTNCGSKRFYED